MGWSINTDKTETPLIARNAGTCGIQLERKI